VEEGEAAKDKDPIVSITDDHLFLRPH
jgi:hypothetical protein